MLRDDLTKIATDLINTYGYDGVLTKVDDINGSYDPTTGQESKTTEDFVVKYVKDEFSTAELQTGLYGIDDFKATIVFNQTIEKNWLIDGAEIINVTQVGLQNGSVIQELVCRK